MTRMARVQIMAHMAEGQIMAPMDLGRIMAISSLGQITAAVLITMAHMALYHLAVGQTMALMGVPALGRGRTTSITNMVPDQAAFATVVIRVKGQQQAMVNVAARSMATMKMNVCKSGAASLMRESAGLLLALHNVLGRE